jgi:phosphoribosylaminoimidazolecarboxamide formyltransferase / IMP cyclohydrolase
MRAIISVHNRDGLAELGRELQARDVAIYSTTGTAHALREANVAAEPISALTGFPEILDGRVKTLHPAVFGGILARRDSERHLRELQEHHLELLDIVVVNLYPFVETIARQHTTLDEALEQVDIGGVSLIRAAAKNFEHVLVLVRPQDYAPVMQEWQDTGQVSYDTRRRLAATAFQLIASYDTAVASYLRAQTAVSDTFPENLTLSLQRIQALRYGENPHQQAALYSWSGSSHSTTQAKDATITGAEVLHGKELSFNNLLDLDAALAAASSFSAPTVVIVKHTNPCGLACDDVLVEAYKKAHAGDPISAFGGIIGCNRPLDADTAHEINQLFYEAIIAPEYTPEAQAILSKKKNIRLLATHRPFVSAAALPDDQRLDVRSLNGGLLLQTPDVLGEQDVAYRVVTVRDPTLEEVTDLMFAWKVVKHVKSNAIVLAHKLAVLGVGAGQMNRVASVQLALEKAAERARGSVLASDAYFPFSDSVEAAARAGITAIIQPGGSIRDEESIRMANRYAIAMIFTGQRHFRH